MTGVRLTDARASRLKPAESEYSVRDTAIPSLSVRVYPSGTRTWTCAVGGRKVSLGRVDLVPVDDARRACLRLQVDGAEPVRDVPTYREFALGAWRDSWSGRCKPATVKGRDHVLARRLLPAFGALRVDRIALADIQDWFDTYSASAPGGANNALRILRQSLKFAVERGLVASNPAASVRPNRRPKLSRFLSRDEIRRMHEALDRHAGGRRGMQADVIRLLLLTGCRKSEIVRLKRREVDGDRLRLEDGKTGPENGLPERRGPRNHREADGGSRRVPFPHAGGPGETALRQPVPLARHQARDRNRGRAPSRSETLVREPMRDRGAFPCRSFPGCLATATPR